MGKGGGGGGTAGRAVTRVFNVKVWVIVVSAIRERGKEGGLRGPIMILWCLWSTPWPPRDSRLGRSRSRRPDRRVFPGAGRRARAAPRPPPREGAVPERRLGQRMRPICPSGHGKTARQRAPDIITGELWSR